MSKKKVGEESVGGSQQEVGDPFAPDMAKANPDFSMDDLIASFIQKKSALSSS